MSKPQILCLHGYGSTSSILKQIMSKHIEKLEPHYELLFIEGIHKARDGKCWFYYDPKFGNNLDWKIVTKEQILGLEESINYINDIIKNLTNFHAIIGFSQGAAFANIIAHQFEVPRVIFCSGFLVQHPQSASQISTNSLHIYGEEDSLITPDLSEQLSEIYTNKQILTHEKGHIFPSNGVSRKVILQFLSHSQMK
jgi:predicted esterase